VIDTILHGTKPAEIAVEQQTQFELVPETLLATADEVIQ
jgi:hypothetical protein